MTRISSFSQTSMLVENALSRQSAVNLAQQQVTTGKKAQTYAGYGADVSLLVSSRSLLARTESYGQATKQLGVRLDQLDLQLTSMKDQAGELKKSILDSLALENAEGLQTRIEQSFKSVVSNLNAEYDGQYLFAGSRVNSKPVTVSDLASLSALPGVANAFTNDNVKATSRIADGQDITHGVLATDVGQRLLQVYKDLNDYATSATTGPLDGKIDATKRTFLEAKLVELETAMGDVQKAQLDNGAKQQQVTSVQQRHETRIADLKELVATIEDVDSAEAIVRLQSNRTALEASYRVLSQIDQLSLNNYL